MSECFRKSPLFIKEFTLLTPQEAIKIGIKSDSPILTSPLMTSGVCEECDTPFGPLVYEPNKQVTSEHFCSTTGGIYIYGVNSPENLTQLLNTIRHGWVGEVRPLGICQPLRYWYRAERVILDSVIPFCMANLSSNPSGRTRCSKPLKCGYAVQIPSSAFYRQDLSPRCPNHLENQAIPVYEFKVTRNGLKLNSLS